jgi:hypothetical protein
MGIFTRIVEANQMKSIRDQNLEILKYLGITGIHRTVASIRMLPFAETRVGNRHGLACQEVA